MQEELPAPGVQDADKAQFCAQMLRVGGDLLERARAFLEVRGIKPAGPLPGRCRATSRKACGTVKVTRKYGAGRSRFI